MNYIDLNRVLEIRIQSYLFGEAVTESVVVGYKVHYISCVSLFHFILYYLV